jgi:prepilin-type N-terminal cleavage/methylation domain-containing protein
MYLRPSREEGFTLIELLVVIAIIAILTVVVILTINPAELLRQSRDSNRLSDMATVNEALGVFTEDVSGGNLGSASTTYISIPDPSATSTAGDQCQGLGMLAQSTSSGWGYQCQGSSNLRNVNSTGWIPENFPLLSSGAPIGSLPIDPSNVSSTGLYYTYTTDGAKYEATAVLESQKYRAQLSLNSPLPDYPGVEAVGTSLSLSGLYNPNGLAGYWPMDEGSGNVTADLSGNGNGGSLCTSPGSCPGASPPMWTSGKAGPSALSFNGASDEITTGVNGLPTGQSPVSVFAWIYPTTLNSNGVSTIYIQGSDATFSGAFEFQLFGPANGTAYSTVRFFVNNASAVTQVLTIPINQWAFVGYVYSGGTSVPITFYYNATKYSFGSVTANTTSTGSEIGSAPSRITQSFPGVIDDVRIYNRALSAAEVQAIYNAEK